jgi:pimeloyl-ACP methyl ester carboxylesterase
MVMKKNTLIFIPGFKGSVLSDQEGRFIWPNFWRAQFDKSTSLSNHLPGIDVRNPLRFKSSDVVQSVSILPSVFKVNIYSQMIKALKQRLPKDTEVILFHYDWRQDLMTTAPRLKALIMRVLRERGGSIDIVGHSMGGLIASYVLKMFETPVIRNAFLVSVPFLGALKPLLDLKKGATLGLNKALLSPKALATFGSIYYLLPRYPDAGKGHSFLDVETWKEFDLSVLMHGNNEQVSTYLQSQFLRVNQFFKLLEDDEQPTGAHKIISVSCHDFATPTLMQLDKGGRVSKGAGDGTVPSASLVLPDYLKDIPHDIHSISQPHSKSFNSEKLINLITR